MRDMNFAQPQCPADMHELNHLSFKISLLITHCVTSTRNEHSSATSHELYDAGATGAAAVSEAFSRLVTI